MFAYLLAVLTLTGGLTNSQVLQREASGTASPVVVGTSNQDGKLHCRINGGLWVDVAKIAAGPWHAKLPALPSGGPYTIQFQLRDAAGHSLAELGYDDILVGDLWVLSGQSNMVGRAIIDETTPTDHRVRMLEMAGGGWKIAAHPIHEGRPGPDGTRKGAGLGLEFGKAMARISGVPIGLIPCAKGGTSMDQWSPALAAQGTASLYGNMLEQVRLAGGKVAGVLWYQGENDTGEEPAVLYPQKFRGLIAKVRDDLGRPELPFYYAQLSRFAGTVTPAYYGAWNQVQEAQRLAETQIPHVGMVATIDLELGDHIHLNQPSLERLGRRFAQAAQGRGGPRLHEVRWVSANELRLRFTGVNGALKAEGGRVFGFEARSPDGNFIPLFHRAFIDPATNEIVFGLNSLKDLPAEMDLWYGRGLDPICNLVDSEDLALPAFGPFRLPALGKIAAKANH